MSPNGLCHQAACVTKRLVSPNGPCHKTICVTKRRVSPNGLCYQAACVTKRSVSPNGLCHQSACATKRPVLPSGLCHQTAHVTKRPVSPSRVCHQTACVTKRPVPPIGLCYQTVLESRVFVLICRSGRGPDWPRDRQRQTERVLQTYHDKHEKHGLTRFYCCMRVMVRRFESTYSQSHSLRHASCRARTRWAL